MALILLAAALITGIAMASRGESSYASSDSISQDLIDLNDNAVMASGYGMTCQVKVDNASGKMKITAQAAKGDVIYGVFINNDFVINTISASPAKIDQSVDVSSYEPGYYLVSFWTKNSYAKEEPAYQKRNVEIFTQKPDYKGVFDVYSKYLFYYPYNIGYGNTGYGLYLEYKTGKTKKWKRYGAMSKSAITLATEQGYTVKKLKPGKKYKTRIRFGVSAQKDDGSTGVIYGPVKNTGTYKTGNAKKLKIRSMTVKTVKKKLRKVKHYGYYTGVYLYTEKYWTCKYKVTIKLKKKPGAKGIWVNGRFLKGNKKKYTTTFTPYPNYFKKKPPKGLKKFELRVCSYKSKKYGGYSPLLKRKCKVR